MIEALQNDRKRFDYKCDYNEAVSRKDAKDAKRRENLFESGIVSPASEIEIQSLVPFLRRSLIHTLGTVFEVAAVPETA